MGSVNFEINKIIFRRYPLILLLGTTILFPLIVIITSYLHVTQDNVPEGLFSNNVAFGIIAYTQTYFFLPVWIIVFVGRELSNGHVNRVVFTKSRKFYFKSKLFYCGLITLFFSCLGLITFLITVQTSPYTLVISPDFYLLFLIQLVFSTLLFSLLLLSLVFMIRSPMKTFVVYFIWTFLEGILFTVFEAIYHIKLSWLPLHLVRTLYTTNGQAQLNNYHNPFFNNFISIVAPVGFILVIIFFTYRLFLKSDLPVLSD